MKSTNIIIVSLLIFLNIFFVIFVFSDSSMFIDGESLIYLFVITLTLVLLLLKADNINRPLIVVLTFYVFLRYLMGALNLLLLSIYKDEAMMFSGYSWASSLEVNIWLRFATICIIFFAAGILLGTNLGCNNKNNYLLENFKKTKNEISLKNIFIVYIIFISVSINNFYHFGFGSISGHEVNPLYTLYGALDVSIVVNIAMILSILLWDSISKRDKFMFLFIIISYVIFRVVTGNRSAIYYILTYYFYFLSTYRGNFIVRRKAVLLTSVFVALSLLVYPVAKSFKHLIIWSGRYMVSGANITLQYLSEGFSLSDSLSNFVQHWKKFTLEIIDRLSEMSAQLRIITDQQVVSVYDHVNLINTFKRIINDIIPGDVFTDVIRTQDVFHVIYYGHTTIYGGENYSLFGVYYMLFGYAGALIALFFSAMIIGFCWKKLVLTKMFLKPILLGLFIVMIHNLFNNPLMEGWFVDSFKIILSLCLTLFTITFISRSVDMFHRAKNQTLKSID